MATISSDENEYEYEWEYEYDDTQKETVYVTLDLPYQRPPELKSDHLTTKQSQPRPNTQAESDQEPVGQSSDEAEVGDDEEQPQVHASDDEEPGNESQGDENSQPDEDLQTERAPKNSVQILDLHARNPLISYNEQVYSCTWGRTIGTDLIFAQPSTSSKVMTPLVQEQGFDLVASSRIKLRGKPVYLERKKNATTTMPLSTLMGQTDTSDSVFVNSNAQDMSQFDIPAPTADTNSAIAVNAAQNVANSDITTSIKDPQAEAHIQERNAWLQRFSEIRQQRGESANIPIRIGKSYIDWVPNPAKSPPTERSTGDAITNDTIENGEAPAELARAPNSQTSDTSQMVWRGVRPGTPDDDDANTTSNEISATLSTTSVASAATPRGRGRGGRRAGRARAGSRGQGRGRGRGGIRSNYETRESRNVIDALTGVNPECEDTPMPDA